MTKYKRKKQTDELLYEAIHNSGIMAKTELGKAEVDKCAEFLAKFQNEPMEN